MEQKFKLGLLYIGQIILTAIVSALIAMLQGWLQTHGMPAQNLVIPAHAAAIGGISSSGIVAYNHTKGTFIKNV